MRSLKALEEEHLLRKPYLIEHRFEEKVIVNGTSLINFCSNDYLNLSTHSEIKKAFLRGAEQYGLGSGSASQISGYFKSHQRLEDAFSEFLNRERSLLFNSGYHANLAVMSTFATRKNVVIADKLCHASLIDGIILSRAKLVRYPHHKISDVENLLNKYTNRVQLLVTESLFSMEGNIAPIKELAILAQKNQTMLVVDDAHGVGVLGINGGGISEHAQLTPQDIPCLITPLGKAFGSLGAIVSGSDTLIENLLQFSRTHRYTTALPPAITDATLVALSILKKDNWRREKLNDLIQLFLKEVATRKISLASYDKTPIKSILIGSNEAALNLQNHLFNKGFMVSCIRPPTVPVNSARIRISLNCLHSEQQVIELLNCLQEYQQSNEK